MTVFAVPMAIVVVAAVVAPALTVVPESTNPANELETFPRLKGTNQVERMFIAIYFIASKTKY